MTDCVANVKHLAAVNFLDNKLPADFEKDMPPGLPL